MQVFRKIGKDDRYVDLKNPLEDQPELTYRATSIKGKNRSRSLQIKSGDFKMVLSNSELERVISLAKNL